MSCVHLNYPACMHKGVITCKNRVRGKDVGFFFASIHLMQATNVIVVFFYRPCYTFSLVFTLHAHSKLKKYWSSLLIVNAIC